MARGVWAPAPALWAVREAFRPRFLPLRAHLSLQLSSTQVDVGQRQGGERTRGVLLQASVSHLGKPPQPLNHGKDVFDPSSHPRLLAVLGPLHLVHLACTARTLVGEVFGFWSLARYQCFLAGIGRVAIDPLFIAMQQIG